MLERRTPMPRGRGLRARRPKRRAQEDRYRRQRARFLDERPLCEARAVLATASRGDRLAEWEVADAHDAAAACWHRSTEVHHLAGRDGDRLLDEARWLPVCSNCHRFITTHPAIAYRLGLAQRRHGRTDPGRVAIAALVTVTVLSAFVFFAVIRAGAAG